MEIIDQAIAYLREGFAAVNATKGLIIALVAVVFMGSWKQWLPLALVAVVVDIAITQLSPLVTGGGGEVALPDVMAEGFWNGVLVLFLGYLVVIGIFYLIKSLIFRRGGAH